MKKLLFAAATVLLASFVYAQDPHLDVHDLGITYTGQTTATRQGCRGCHIPHGGSAPRANGMSATERASGAD